MNDSIWIKFYTGGELRETATFSEIQERATERAKALRGIGLESGDRVIVQMPNSIEAVVDYFALRQMRAIAVPVNPADAKIKIDFVLQDCRPKAIITPAEEIEPVREQEKREVVSETNDLDIATIIYTSGTTGKPKGVCLTQENWQANAKALIRHHQLSDSTVIATPLPLFHCNAHGLGMYTTFLAKNKLILFDKMPYNFLEIINREEVNIASVVPALLYKLAKNNQPWRPHKNFNYFLTAAAPLSADLLRKVMEQWDVKVVQGYGLTESTNFSCTLPTDLSETLYQHVMFPRPSIGVALQDVEVAIADSQDGIGEVLIKSESNSPGYWGNSLQGQHVIKTGDIGYSKDIDGRRFYYLHGRIKELINRGGEKLYPLELEAELRSMGIQDAHVFSLPSEQFGEEVGLTVLQSFDFSILKSMSLYRRPKKIFEVAQFPQTPTAKLQRAELARMCQSPSAKLIWQYGEKYNT